MWREYLCPDSVDEALSLLAHRAGQARVIAGGTDLVLQLQRGEKQAVSLVDISRIRALRGISETDGAITVGAAVTHGELASSQLILERAPILAQAAAKVGSPEVRSVATVGGNIVNAQPAADTALALMALSAEAELVGASGARWLKLADLYRGAGTSVVDSTTELVRAFRFHSPAGQVGAAYRRLGKCKSIALPVLCAATVVQLEDDRFTRCAIALGPVAPRPFRATTAEEWLVGRPATAETIAHAASLAQKEADPRDSLLRCAREYREAMVTVLVQSTLEQAVAAAGQSPEGAS